MKKPLIFAVAAVIGIGGGLYFASDRGESPAVVQQDFTALEDLRTGDMMKLQFGADRGSDVVFTSEDGSDLTLAAYEGQYVLLNFWATWCAPCRKEMPHLSELQSEFGGDDFQVVTVATGLNQRPAMQRFLDEIGVDNLPLHTDGSSALARDMGVVGLPVTLIMDPQGQEVARLIGDADWASDSAKAILTALMDGQ
ncbi:Thiol-disulfide isomerase or thioredoxin [Octadecabacter temperatus]|uniref:Thiol:disulfide interchange protein TlpA n=1 Tax=Octadecabacter temperatus TaxID=1458307 RepID=A0A0K0Y949_9RHOB|nr:TlpA disulfide reductase family protein [Octadecabacter temperatus]AKS47416.1 Thiol:disulfide interchange protein TlpA [Octadecabacter temperatus]SIO42927.1 Thiol-disulfide isomerase or thioredoxin [Octadecabacter temperatus]